MNSWKDAIKDACIVNHVEFYPGDAKKSLANLVNWGVFIALDPKASEDAQRAIEQGRLLPGEMWDDDPEPPSFTFAVAD